MKKNQLILIKIAAKHTRNDASFGIIINPLLANNITPINTAVQMVRCERTSNGGTCEI